MVFGAFEHYPALRLIGNVHFFGEGHEAIVGGKSQLLKAIASLPTNEQLAAGNDAIQLEFIEQDIDGMRSYDHPHLMRWIEDCGEELKGMLYDFFDSMR